MGKRGGIVSRCAPATRDGGPAWPVKPKPRVSMMRQGVIPTKASAPVTSAGPAFGTEFVEVAFELTAMLGAALSSSTSLAPSQH